MVKNPIKEETAADKKRHYSMKIVTQIGSIEHIDWGWSSYEDRQRRARYFHIFDGMIAFVTLIQFTLISFTAAFDPMDRYMIGASYILDYFMLADVIATVMKCYLHDIRNVELRKNNSWLNRYLHSLFILDICSLLPFEIMVLVLCQKSTNVPPGLKDTVYMACTMPKLTYCRINRLVSGYKVFRVSSTSANC